MPPVRSSEFTVAAKGTYLALLCQIETKSAQQRNDKGEERESSFWVWKFRGFITKDQLRKQVPIEFTTGTGVSAKAGGLKSLLMSAYPDMTLDQMKTFDTDTMIGKAWVLKVGVEERPNGGERNVLLNIEPSEDDPFSDKAEEDDD